MDFDNPSTWLGGGLGGAILFFACKALWPIISSNLSSALTTTRTGEQLMKQVMEERDRAVARADAADKRVETMVAELYELKNNVSMLTYQLQDAKKKIEDLTAEVRLREGGGNHA